MSVGGWFSLIMVYFIYNASLNAAIKERRWAIEFYDGFDFLIAFTKKR
jgi:hypothetical protein